MAQEGTLAVAGLERTGKNAAPMSAAKSQPRPFGAVVRDLLIEKEIVTAIGNPNWMEFSYQLEGVSYESLRKAVTGERAPGARIMEAVASALDVEPDVFWEYQLLQAQRAFDPSEVGDEIAFANLQAWLKSRKK